MMRKSSVIQSDESGEIMIESIIIVIITTIVLIFMISLGFLLYQKSLVSTVANETAAEIAQSYKYNGILSTDITTQQEALSALESTKKYRYLFSSGALAANSVSIGETYATNRLAQTSFATLEGAPTVLVSTEKADLGRRFIKVTVEVEYTIFLGRALKVFGMDETYTISSTSYAECNDISNYCNTVKFTEYIAGKIDGATSFTEAVKSMADLFESVFGL